MARKSRAWIAIATLIAVACSSPVPPSPSVSPLSQASPAPASNTPQPSATPEASLPPKVVGDLELEECDPQALMPCEHQEVVLAETIPAAGVMLTYSTEWADGRLDRPRWNADALGLGGWALDVLQRYDPERGILLSGDGSWRIAEAVDIGDGERAVPAFDGFSYAVFDADWRHVRTVDAVTGIPVLTVSYDDAGRLSEVQGQADFNVVQLRVTRNPNGTPSSLVGTGTTATSIAVDSNGHIAGVVRSDGSTLFVTENDLGLVRTWQKMGRGAVSYEYDDAGRLTKATDPDGVVQQLAFEAGAGSVAVTITDTTGGTAIARADRDGDTIRRSFTDTDGTVTQLDTSPDGSTRLTDPDGVVSTSGAVPHPRWGLAAPVLTPFVETRPDGTEYRVETTTTMGSGSLESAAAWQTEYTMDGARYVDSYDPSTRTITRSDPQGRQSTITFDDRSRLVGYRLPGLPPHSFTYDGSGRLAAATIGEGESAAVTTYASNPDNGDLIATYPDGSSITSSYDTFGNLSRASAEGESFGLLRDSAGSVIQVRPGGHPATSFGYSEAGRPTAYIPPVLDDDSSYEMTTYTPGGQVATIDGPGERRVDIAYDTAGRATSWTFDRGVSNATYGAQTGLLESNTSPDGLTTSFTYSGGVPTQLSWSGAVNNEFEVSFDGQLRPTSETVNGGNEIIYGYDAAGYLTSIGALQIERDQVTGLPVRASVGMVATTSEYDANGRLEASTTSVAGEQVLALRYTRDKLGRVVSLEQIDARGRSSTTAYTYDSSGRLASVSVDGAVETYAYDESGNRISATSGNSGAVTAAYDDRDRVVASGGDTFSYEPDGTLRERQSTDGATVSYDFDDLGALRSVGQPDGRRIHYVIDAGGRRVGRMVDDVLTDGYVYGIDDSIVAQTDGAGQVVARFAYDELGRLALVTHGDQELLVLTDQIGSPVALIDTASGEVVEAIAYDAWGNVTGDSSPGLIPFGFAGGLADPDTGLVHFGARDYDPSTGRWTAPDPLRFAGGDANLYRYAGGDPVNLVDPTGTSTCGRTACGAAGGGPLFSGTVGGSGRSGLGGGTGLGGARPYHDAGPSKVIVEVGPAVIDTGGGVSVEVGPAVIENNSSYSVEVGPAQVESGGSYNVTIGPATIQSPGTVGGGGRAGSPGAGSGAGQSSGAKRSSGPTGAPAGTKRPGGSNSGGGRRSPGMPGSGPKKAKPNRPSASGNCFAVSFCVPSDRSEYPGSAPNEYGRPERPEGLGGPNIFGEPHVVTSDGVHVNFQAAGEFLAAQSSDGTLVIQTRFETPPNNTVVTRTTGLALKVAGDRVAFYANAERPMTVNDEVIQRADYARTLPSGGVLERHGSSAVVRWPDGSLLVAHLYARFINFGMSLSSTVAPTLTGLMGSGDGDASNDVKTRTGIVISAEDADFQNRVYAEFGNSWRISQEKSLFDYAEGESTQTFTRPEIPSAPATIESLDDATRTNAETLCGAMGVTSDPILSDCILDVGMTGDPTYAASAMTVDVALQVTNASQADLGTTVEIGQPVSGQLAAGTVDRYHFSAQAGDIVYIDSLGTCDPLLRWQLLRPGGVLSTFEIACNDIGRRVLDTSGEWRLEVYSEVSAAGSYSFQVISVPQPTQQSITLGQSVTGATSAIGEWHRYALSGTEGQVVYLDAEGSCDSPIWWRLLNPKGTLQTFERVCTDMGRRVLDVTGDWVIEIYADDVATGSYAFRVVDAPAARETAMTVGQIVTDATTRIGEWHRYRFAATTGDIVYLDGLGECVAGLYWRLLYPTGQLRTFATTCNDMRRVPLDATGDWTIEVYADDLSFGGYSFHAIAVPPVKPFTITLGQNVSGTIAEVGEWHRYTLAAQAAESIVVDAQGECVPDLWWRLLRPEGSLVTFAATCTDSSALPLDVTGDWSIEIYSDNQATGAYSLTINLAP